MIGTRCILAGDIVVQFVGLPRTLSCGKHFAGPPGEQILGHSWVADFPCQLTCVAKVWLKKVTIWKLWEK